jgi:hypothetical protein
MITASRSVVLEAITLSSDWFQKEWEGFGDDINRGFSPTFFFDGKRVLGISSEDQNFPLLSP